MFGVLNVFRCVLSMKNLPKETNISSDEIFLVSFPGKGNRHTHENVLCISGVLCSVNVDLNS